MKFFVPRAKAQNYQSVYDDLAAGIKDQLKATIGERRIFSLTYRQDKRDWRLQVGEVEPRENRYQVLAIFESKPYLVFAKSKNSDQAITILIDAEQVTGVEEFDRV